MSDPAMEALSAIAGRPVERRELDREPGRKLRWVEPATAQVCASVPRGRHVVVNDSGHYIHHDRPELVLTAIADVVDAAERDR